MQPSSPLLTRRNFTKTTMLAGVALTSGTAATCAADVPAKRIRTGVIGCGSVSHSYLPVLTTAPYVEVVSLCALTSTFKWPIVS